MCSLTIKEESMCTIYTVLSNERGLSETMISVGSNDRCMVKIIA